MLFGSAGADSSRGGSSGGAPAATSSSCACCSRARSGSSASIRSSNGGGLCAHSSPSSASASRASPLRVRVFTVPSGMWRNVGDLALREAGEVRKVDHRALVLGQRLERPVDAPGIPGRLGLLVGRRAGRHELGRIGDGGEGAPALHVDDRVARDRVEPGATRPARSVVARGRAPDGREHLLHRVLGPAAIAEATEGESEHRAGVARVELLEGLPLVVGHALDQRGVGGLGHGHAPDRGDSGAREQAKRKDASTSRSTRSGAERIGRAVVADRCHGPR